MIAWPGPSLKRRIVVGSLLAACSVWLAVFAMDLYFVLVNRQDGQRRFLANESRQLERFESAAQVQAFMRSEVRYLNRDQLPDQQIFIEIWSRDGKRVFFDEYRPTSGPLPGADQSFVPDGYRLMRHDGARWSVHMAEPGINAAQLIHDYGAHISRQIWVCAPFLFLPMWFALARGLVPLRRLSARLGLRAEHDLSPLHFDARYGEIQPLVQALDGLLAALQQKVAREHAFLQDAAHELRTPLAVIAGQTHILARATDAAQRELAAQQITHAIARGNHLTYQLLELAWVDGAALQQRQWLDLTELAQMALAQMTGQASARQINLSISAESGLFCWIEQNTLQSILQNLLDNAIRYGNTDGRVEISLRQQEGVVLMSVTDDGPGIPVAEQALVFERFYRGRGQQVQGSGLGLAIVQQAAQRLGASLALTTGWHGKGCCFTVRLAMMQYQAL